MKEALISGFFLNSELNSKLQDTLEQIEVSHLIFNFFIVRQFSSHFYLTFSFTTSMLAILVSKSNGFKLLY